MPLGIGYIAAYLVQQKVVSRDEICVADSIDETIAFKPDILCVSATSQVIKEARDFAKEVKGKIKCLTVLGGYHVTCIPQKLPEEFDLGILGEGEKTFAEVVSLFKEGSFLSAIGKVKGICYYADGKVAVNKPRELIENLDSLPWPYRHKEYSSELPISTSRGCPYRCIYCASPTFWQNTYRLRSAGSVVSEINHIVSKHHPKQIVILDDLWIADKKRFREIVNALVKFEIPKKVSFRGFCRSNLLWEEEIMLLKKMNYSHIRFGAETGSESLLKCLKGKNISVSDHQRVIDLCQKHKMQCGASFMFGVPGETMEDIEKTISFLRKNKEKLDISGFYLFNPLPGTKIWEVMKNKNMVSENIPFEQFRITFLNDSFSWDNIQYFNQDIVPLNEFKKLMEEIKSEFIEAKPAKNNFAKALFKEAASRIKSG